MVPSGIGVNMNLNMNLKASGKSPVIGSRRAGEPFELTALLTGERRQRRVQTATVPLPIGSATSERKEL
jgi:hypothetical protein